RAPGGRAPALRVEGEAAEPDRPGAGGHPAHALDDRVPSRLPGRRGDLGEAPRTPRGRLARDAHPGPREATVRLLPAAPAVAGQPRGEDRGAGVLEVDGGGDADQRPPSLRYASRERP